MVLLIQSILLLNLLLLTASYNTTQVNLSLLMDVIHVASNYHQFETIPIVTSHQTLFEIEGFIRNLQTTLQRPIYILAKKIPDFFFRYRINVDSLFLIFFKGPADTILDITETYTRGRHLTSILFVLTRPPKTQLEIQYILRRAWKNYYLHALLLYRDSRGQDYLLTFDRYPEFKIRSVLAAYGQSDLFALRGTGKLNGYKIRSPVKSDLPRVFMMTDSKSRKRVLGVSFHIFMNYVKYMNATFEEYIMSVNQTHVNVPIGDILQLISVGEIEASVHAYAMHAVAGGGCSYPLRLTEVCVVIPMSNEIPSYMYLLRPIQFNTWMLVVFATFYLAATMMWIPPNSKHKLRREFGLSLLHSIGYMLNLSICEAYKNVSWKYFFAHKARWILGFILTSWYGALLESYLTATVFGPQIDTMEDIIASGLKVVASEYDVQLMKKVANLPPGFMKMYHGIDADLVARLRNELNTSYAYVVAMDRWNFMNMQQQFMRRPAFRLSHICFFKHYLAFHLASDSGLQYSLNYFILYIQQSGLVEHWMKADFNTALRGGYFKVKLDSYEATPLNGENMRLAWEVLGIGLGISAVVFIIEVSLLVNRCKSQWVFLSNLGGNKVNKVSKI